VVTPSQVGFDGWLPTKWSPSSTVKTNRLFDLLIPSDARRLKNAAKASS
jgi:hypothetical protein